MLGCTYKWYRVVSICDNKGVKVFCPPHVHSPQRIVLSQRQLPPVEARSRIRRWNPGDILDSGTQDQVLVQLMRCNIIFQILPRDMMRWEWPICESCIRKAHRYIRHICSVSYFSLWIFVPLVYDCTYVKELYTGVLEYRSCSTGAVTLGSWSGICTGGSICGGSFPGFMGSSGPGDASNILFDVSSGALVRFDVDDLDETHHVPPAVSRRSKIRIWSK